MSNDLISRKALLKKLEGKNSYSVNTATELDQIKASIYASVICLIEHEHAAYDVDKVIEELEKPENYCVINGKHIISVERVIDIVKAGEV